MGKFELVKRDGEEITFQEAFSTVSVDEGYNMPCVRFTTPECDHITLFSALNDKAESVEDFMDEEVIVEHIVVTAADVQEEMNNPDAPFVNKPVIHFFLDDGTHISSLSNGIRRCTMNLVSCGIIPSPDHPVHLKFKRVKVARGNAHSFTVLGQD